MNLYVPGCAGNDESKIHVRAARQRTIAICGREPLHRDLAALGLHDNTWPVRPRVAGEVVPMQERRGNIHVYQCQQAVAPHRDLGPQEGRVCLAFTDIHR